MRILSCIVTVIFCLGVGNLSADQTSVKDEIKNHTETSTKVVPQVSQLPKSAPQLMGQNPGDNMLNVTVGLLAVLTIIIVIAWVVKRFGQFSLNASGQLRILGGLQVGAKERVLLLQVGKQQLLVGVTAGNIRTLCVLNEPLAVTENRIDGNQPFAARLVAAIRSRAQV